MFFPPWTCIRVTELITEPFQSIHLSWMAHLMELWKWSVSHEVTFYIYHLCMATQSSTLHHCPRQWEIFIIIATTPFALIFSLVNFPSSDIPLQSSKRRIQHLSHPFSAFGTFMVDLDHISGQSFQCQCSLWRRHDGGYQRSCSQGEDKATQYQILDVFVPNVDIVVKMGVS